MERRLFTFMLASTAFLVVYSGLRILFDVQPPAPPEPENVVAEAPADVADDQVAEADADDPANDAANDDAANALAIADTVSDDETETAADPDVVVVEEQPALVQNNDTPQRWFTLGSMAANSPYNMLVYTTSRGSGLERIELTERGENGRLKYRRVDTRSGYLGYFAGRVSLEPEGVRVRVVGPGTPASTAKADSGETGIEPGDVIVAVQGKTVLSPADIDSVLKTTKPGDEVSVDVVRGNVGTPVVFQATLSEHPLDLVRLASTGGEEQIDGNLDRLSCLMTLEKINQKGIPVGKSNIAGVPDARSLVWDVDDANQDDEVQSVTFRLPISRPALQNAGGDAVELVRTYSLTPGKYDLGMSIEVVNKSDQPQDLAYRLEGVNGLTLEGWWYSNKISPNWGGAAARDIVYKTDAAGHELISGYGLLKTAKSDPSTVGQNIFAPDNDVAARRMKYIGVDAQYFTVAYVPNESAALEGYRRATASLVAAPGDVPKHKERAVNISYYLDSNVATIAPGQSIRHSLSIFAGPKRPELLETYAMGDCVYYGWFSWPAKILGNVLHMLYALVGNYAVAIILLTVLVRGLMFPFSRKAAVNAQKMQELAPEMKKITEKYKDDMEGRLKAQRELQQRVGFNPLAGCAPMFLQLPVFIGLYRALSVDIELRQAAFSSATSWASNLAGPDMLAYWGDWLWDYLSGRGTGWLGPYFNILPILVMGLFLAQQKMFMPPATDEQTAMTQKIMSYMTLLMGLFFFRVPAGLCIYFITSSLWGICERIMVKKTLPQGKHFDDAVLEGGVERPKSTSSKIADRLRQQISPEQPTVEKPNKRKRPDISKKKR